MNTDAHRFKKPLAANGAPGGTGFQPVVSGILPETRGALCVPSFPNDRITLARAKSGKDAGFNRLDACSTRPITPLINCLPRRSRAKAGKSPIPNRQ